MLTLVLESGSQCMHDQLTRASGGIDALEAVASEDLQVLQLEVAVCSPVTECILPRRAESALEQAI